MDLAVAEADAGDYAALVLPGGVANGDALRLDEDARRFVKAFLDAGKPVATICHAPWILADIDAVRGRTMTSWPTLQTDLRNAGATWVDQELKECTAQGFTLLTSRTPDDLEAFTSAVVAAAR